jgi:hypothetical protein
MKSKQSKKSYATGSKLGLTYSSTLKMEAMFLRKVGRLSPDYTALITNSVALACEQTIPTE